MTASNNQNPGPQDGSAGSLTTLERHTLAFLVILMLLAAVAWAASTIIDILQYGPFVL